MCHNIFKYVYTYLYIYKYYGGKYFRNIRRCIVYLVIFFSLPFFVPAPLFAAQYSKKVTKVFRKCLHIIVTLSFPNFFFLSCLLISVSKFFVQNTTRCSLYIEYLHVTTKIPTSVYH